LAHIDYHLGQSSKTVGVLEGDRIPRLKKQRKNSEKRRVGGVGELAT